MYEEKKELKNELFKMEEKLLSERESYDQMLSEKERVIEELWAELASFQMQVDDFEKR